MSDNGKPRLFIKRNHISSNLTSPAEIRKAYVTAQTGGDVVLPDGNQSHPFNRSNL